MRLLPERGMARAGVIALYVVMALVVLAVVFEGIVRLLPANY